MASLGVSLADLPDEAPLALFLWEPGDARALAALLPLPPDAPLPARLRMMLGADKVMPAPGGTLAAATSEGMARARLELDALARLTAAPMSSQVQLHLRLAAIRAHYQRSIDDFFAGLEKLPPPKTPLSDGMKRVNQLVLTELRGWFTNLVSLTVDAAGPKDYLETTVTLRDADSTAVAPPPRSSPDLAGFLPDGQFRVELDGDHLHGGLTSLLRGLYGALLADDAPARERMNRWLRRWDEVSPGSRIGASLSVGEHGLSGATLIASPHADQMMALIEDGYQLMAEPPMRKAMQQGAFEMSMERQLGARKIAGWKVDRYRYLDRPLQAPASVEQAKLVEKFGNNVFEIVRAGSFVIQTINAQPGELEALVADVMAGQRHGHSLRAKQDFPVSGLFHADFDAGALYENFRRLMPAAIKLPPLTGSPPALSLYGYSGAGVSEYRLRVPTAFITAVSAAAQNARNLQKRP
jgi:hypothetical protein